MRRYKYSTPYSIERPWMDKRDDQHGPELRPKGKSFHVPSPVGLRHGIKRFSLVGLGHYINK